MSSRKVIMSLALALGAIAAFSPASVGAAFLEGLSERASRVDSSPYATGGDVILCISAKRGEYVHVFTNVAAAETFTPVRDIKARALLLAGGGSGGTGYFSHGGGGGAGGMLETNGLVLAQGVAYDVVVGAGGAAVTGNDNKVGNCGTATTFAGLTAVGGGGGGGFQNNGGANNNGRAGGSGGGGGGSNNQNGSGGAGTVGQGFAGGSGLKWSTTAAAAPSGGGGGAGMPGGDSVSETQAGSGGDGRVSDILGFDQCFGGGGGGGGNVASQADGGLGGGGAGSCTAQENGSDGVDGLGGGGGGAACNGSGAYSGRGGNGVLAVRYFAADPLSEIHCVTSSVSYRANWSIDFSATYRNYDTAGTTVSATMETWPKDDPSAKTVCDFGNAIPSQNMVDLVLTTNATGFAAGKAYVCRFTITNAGGAHDSIEREFAAMEPCCDPTISGVDPEDYVVCHGVDDSDEVYIFTNVTKTAVFTPSHSGFVRLLLVGGGAAGFSNTPKYDNTSGGGGGGGGGFLPVAEQYVQENVPYEIHVGAGSPAVPNSWVKSSNGGNSSFGEIVALGGGAGGGDAKVGSNGGCGGGGGTGNAAPGESVGGQGQAGGATDNDSGMGGGGGGASLPGSAPTATRAGNGGDGELSDITGEPIVYAGGGGGGAGTDAAGGLGGSGGGGAGAGGADKAQPGVDGLGGGGGGGNNGNGSKTSGAGRGGNGVVVVRFTDRSKLSDDPKFLASFSNVTTSSIDVDVSVSYCGITADSVTVKAVWGYAADALTHTNVLSAAQSGRASYTVDGLFPGRGYVMRIVVSNATGGVTEGADHVFTATQGLASDTTLTHVAYAYGFGFTVTAVGSQALTATLYVGEGDQLVACETLPVTAPGTYLIEHAYSKADAEKTIRYRIELTETEDGYVWTQKTETKSHVVSDNLTYTFSAPDGSGYWTDETSWTPSAAVAGFGAPVSPESIAKFPNNSTSVVFLTSSVRPSEINLKMTGSTVTFKGLADGITVSSVLPAMDYIVGANSTFVIDHLTYVANPTSGGWPKLSARQGLVLRNGAAFSYGYGIEMENSDGNFISAESGSSLSCGSLWCRPGSCVRVDDATVSVNGDFKPTYSASATGATAMDLRISGAAPSFAFGTIQCGRGDLAMFFDIPETPWTVAPIRTTGRFATEAHGFLVNLPAKQAFKVARCQKSVDIPLIRAEGGIAKESVTLGANPLVSRTGSGFFYSEDGKTLYYRYVSPGGMMIVVR